MKISVKTNLDQVLGNLRRQLRDQIPYATARALTQTAKDVQAAETAEINRAFDRPTPFTQKAVGIVPATKRSLSASVFLKDVQAAYLGLQVTGGTRLPKHRALLLPGRALKLNQYGNVPRGKVRTLLARKDVFSGVVHGIGGIWQRAKVGPPKLLIAYEPRAQYRPRLAFYDIATKTIERSIVANVEAALRQALATAR